MTTISNYIKSNYFIIIFSTYFLVGFWGCSTASIGGQFTVGSDLSKKGFSFANDGKYAQALQAYNKSLEMRKKSLGKNHIKVANNYNNIGFLHDKLGNFQEALNNYRKALEINERLNNEQAIAKNHNNIGLIYTQLGDFDEAVKHYNQSLQLSKKNNNKQDIMVNYINLGFTYENWWFHFDKDNNTLKEKAFDYYNKALALSTTNCTSIKNCANTIFVYNNLGFLYNRIGNHNKALEYTNKALEMRQKIYGDNHLETSTSYHNLGIINDSIAKTKSSNQAHSYYNNALSYHQKGVNIREQVFGTAHTSTGISYFNIANTYAGLHHYNQSYKYMKKAFDIYRNDSDKYATMFDTNQKRKFIKLRKDEMAALLKAAYMVTSQAK